MMHFDLVLSLDRLCDDSSLSEDSRRRLTICSVIRSVQQLIFLELDLCKSVRINLDLLIF